MKLFGPNHPRDYRVREDTDRWLQCQATMSNTGAISDGVPVWGQSFDLVLTADQRRFVLVYIEPEVSLPGVPPFDGQVPTTRVLVSEVYCQIWLKYNPNPVVSTVSGFTAPMGGRASIDMSAVSITNVGWVGTDTFVPPITSGLNFTMTSNQVVDSSTDALLTTPTIAGGASGVSADVDIHSSFILNEEAGYISPVPFAGTASVDLTLGSISVPPITITPTPLTIHNPRIYGCWLEVVSYNKKTGTWLTHDPINQYFDRVQDYLDLKTELLFVAQGGWPMHGHVFKMSLPYPIIIGEGQALVCGFCDSTVNPVPGTGTDLIVPFIRSNIRIFP